MVGTGRRNRYRETSGVGQWNMEAPGVELGATLLRPHPLGSGEAGAVHGQHAPERDGAAHRDGGG